MPAQSLIKLPQDFDVRDFPSPYGYQTAVFALQHRGMLQAGETLLVLGAAGGVGITTVEIGKSMGATVIAAASTGAPKLLITPIFSVFSCFFPFSPGPLAVLPGFLASRR